MVAAVAGSVETAEATTTTAGSEVAAVVSIDVIDLTSAF